MSFLEWIGIMALIFSVQRVLAALSCFFMNRTDNGRNILANALFYLAAFTALLCLPIWIISYICQCVFDYYSMKRYYKKIRTAYMLGSTDLYYLHFFQSHGSLDLNETEFQRYRYVRQYYDDEREHTPGGLWYPGKPIVDYEVWRDKEMNKVELNEDCFSEDKDPRFWSIFGF